MTVAGIIKLVAHRRDSRLTCVEMTLKGLLYTKRSLLATNRSLTRLNNVITLYICNYSSENWERAISVNFVSLLYDLIMLSIEF